MMQPPQRPAQLIWTDKAIRDMKRLDRNLRQRIFDAAKQYADTGYGDVLPLRGRHREGRLRVGDWRVLIKFDETFQSVHVMRVLPRGSAYKP